MGKVQIFDFSRTPNTNTSTNILILKTANTNMTFFGYLGSKIPQSFGTQIYLYPIMQVLANHYDIVHLYASAVHIVTNTVHKYEGKECQIFTGFVIIYLLTNII